MGPLIIALEIAFLALTAYSVADVAVDQYTGKGIIEHLAGTESSTTSLSNSLQEFGNALVDAIQTMGDDIVDAVYDCCNIILDYLTLWGCILVVCIACVLAVCIAILFEVRK